MAAEVDSDLFMSVRLDDSGRICNVLVSSQTTGQDVVECLKPDDDKVYYLVEIWKGCERPISNQEKLKSVLLQWGSDVEDVTFLLKRKLASSRQKQAQKQAESPRGSPVQFEDHLHEQQTKVESMERELHEKENYLKILRAKDGAKNGVKTKYVRHLEMKVLQQEEQLRRLRCLEDELFKYQVDNEKLVLELQRLRSMFAMKHQELVDATVRVELLSEQLTQNYRAGRLRGNPGVSIDEMTRDANTMDSPPSQVASTRKHLPGYFHTPRLTVAQAARLNANNVRNKTLVTTVNRSDSIRNRGSGTVGNGPSSFGDAGVFLEHVELQEHDDLYSLLSWRDEEEDDTETSADSGHVSVDHDSPSYRSGGVGSSFQFNGPPGVRYFEKVERFDMDQDFGRPTQPKGPQKEVYSEDMGSLRKSLKESRLSSVEDSLLRRATKHVSRAKASAVRGAPLRETSGLKHSPSEENHRRPLFVQLGQEGRSPATFPFSKTQSSQDSPQSTSSLSSQSSQMNSDGELRVVNARGRSKSPAYEPPRNTSADGVTTSAGQDTRRKSGTGEINKARTAGSISLYQRNQFDCGSPNPKDHSAARIVGPEEETPVVCPGISFQERRASDPVIPSQSNLRSTDSKKEGRSSPRVKDREMETSGIVTKQREKPPPEVGGRPVTSAEVQDILNDVPSLIVTPREVRPLQIQTRAEKDSENNGGILPAEKTTSKTSTVQSPVQGPAISDDKSHPAPRLAPKPLPRKRAKTPPARTSGDVVSAVSSSTTISESTTVDRPTVGKEDFRGQKKRSSSDTMEHVIDGGRSREQKSGKGGACGGPGTSVGESSLKKNGARGSKKSGKRVSLDPHAVLLHASLEGELDLVKSIIHQVEDPSYPNTEGLTALHHAVCNSHDGIVKFLVEYGCDINAADMQGWTSLHCAAANNSLEICKFLVSRGACVFAVTAIEGKTPSQCCEKGSENFKECFSYLSDLENNFGISNDGVVYAVYAYQANRKDELSFESGERLTVVRRGDVTEKDWWWARDSRNQFGYVPRNLLGLCPRIAPDV